MLDHFTQAADQLASGQAAQDIGVDEDQAGLVEGADQVFSQPVVDRGLAADAGVDLRDDGGGHLDKGDAAEEGGGHEAGQVADHAPAQGQDPGAAVEFGLDELSEDLFGGGQVFVGVAPWDEHFERLKTGFFQAGQGWLQVEIRDGPVGDHRYLAAQFHLTTGFAQLRQDSVPHPDGVSPISEGYFDVPHSSAPVIRVRSKPSPRAGARRWTAP